jgi:hypothetical protein
MIKFRRLFETAQEGCPSNAIIVHRFVEITTETRSIFDGTVNTVPVEIKHRISFDFYLFVLTFDWTWKEKT